MTIAGRGLCAGCREGRAANQHGVSCRALVHAESRHAFQHAGAHPVETAAAPDDASDQQARADHQLQYASDDQRQQVLREENLHDHGDATGQGAEHHHGH